MMIITRTLARTAAMFVVFAGLTALPALAQAPAGGEGNALEGRIASLHQQLQITPDQETKWDAVAKVMRRNAEASRALVMERRKDEETMTAKDDLNAYAEIATAHARHVRKLAKVFAELYDSMSDAQKKVADQVFRDHKRQAEGPAPAPSR